MDTAEAIVRLATQPTGHLATVDPDGYPHIVVVTFALVSGSVVTAIDHKPKTTTRLKRITNIENNGRASFLVDHYDDDWAALWWVRVEGTASILHMGELFDMSIDALVSRYPQYQERRPQGPVIALSYEAVTSWESTP